MGIPEYIAPSCLEDALKIKQEKGADARVIAGGTDLILRMRDRLLAPGILVDLRQFSLDKITSHNDEIHLGASVTLSQLLHSSEIATEFPALLEACRPFAGPPIRNRGTLGGNIVNASPAADLVPPLMAYDASIVLSSSSGDRVMPLTEFLTGPGQTVMRPDEILTEVRIPLVPPATVASFTKLGQRRSMAISIVNLGIRVTLAATGVVIDARIVLGSVAPTVVRAIAAEGILEGNKISTELIEQAANKASEEISPITDVRASKHYRLQMTKVLVRRALNAAWHDLGINESND